VRWRGKTGSRQDLAARDGNRQCLLHHRSSFRREVRGECSERPLRAGWRALAWVRRSAHRSHIIEYAWKSTCGDDLRTSRENAAHREIVPQAIENKQPFLSAHRGSLSCLRSVAPSCCRTRPQAESLATRKSPRGRAVFRELHCRHAVLRFSALLSPPSLTGVM
jgi:hypothetical protein